MARRNVFEKALDLLHTKGWIKGSLEDENGYCLYGALNSVLQEERYSRRTRLAVSRHLVRTLWGLGHVSSDSTYLTIYDPHLCRALHMNMDRPDLGLPIGTTINWDEPALDIAANVNDADSTTFEDVAMILKHAAHDWRRHTTKGDTVV